MPRCVIIGCNNSGNHTFPKDLKLRKLWEKATKKPNFTASKNSRICSQHFKETDFQGICNSTGLPQVHRYLKKTAVPSVFPWTKATTPAGVAREKRYKNRSSKKEPSTSQEYLDKPIAVITEEADHRVFVFCPEHLPEDPNGQLKMEETTADTDLISSASSKTVSTQTPPIFRLFSSGDDMLSDARSVFCQAKLENIKKFNLYLIEEFK